MDALGINLAHIIFQIINFVIVFAVLSKFVYKPVLKFIEKQKQDLANQALLANEISTTKEKFEQTKLENQEALKKLKDSTIVSAQSEATRLMEQAKQEATKEGKRILEEYKQEAEQVKRTILNDTSKQIHDLVKAKTEELLKESITPEQQAKLLELSLERLTNEKH